MASDAALNPAAPPAGALDHDLYDRRRTLGAPAARWPGEKTAAAFVLIHLEMLELDPPAAAVRDPGLGGEFGTYQPAWRTWSTMEYGSRIGVFRLLDLLQPLGWSVALAVNGALASREPTWLRELAARDVEIMASSWSASRMITGALAEDEERELLARSIDAVAEATGERPWGYASQDYGYSARTPGLLETLGIEHAVDWPNDERPFAFGPQRRMVMLPAAGELDDAQAMGARRMRPRDWGEALETALAWWHGSALPGSVFVLPLHAWMAGAPHRFAALRRALTHTPAQSFWQAPPREVAAVWRTSAGAG